MTVAKKFKTVLSTLAALASVCALAQPASAPPLAKEGFYEQTLCFGGSSHVINASETDRYGSYVLTGGTQSVIKAFDAMALECIGTWELRSTVFQQKGYCVFQDPSGDKIHGTDTVTPQGYSVELLGGTGKFKGISGSAKIERLGAMSTVRQGTMQGCRRISGSYKLS